MKTLGIIGAGQLGQQIAHFAISDNHYGTIVFFDDFTNENIINGFTVLGKTKDVENEYKRNNFDELIIAIGYKHMSVRKNFFERFKNIIPFGKIIHSTTFIDSTSQIGKGVIIYPGCIIDANVMVEDNILVNIGVVISHDSIVGAHSFLSPRVAIAGFSTIGQCCILGINSTIIDNIEIKENIKLGAGAVVIKNLNESGLYVGNPVRFIRAHDSI
ncbi:acetyltransferase [Maribacter arcticus]|uniref:Sugar O-acyltransferase, sialic acid O-acetyltransferase NeuD family n=1 Tax=Maribacter arcticus TaxID=561365 RepID=A0A1T5BV85_9FLAO|nr:acetyltransferase [Maribacter arcticus]SKB51024.1 sugar O-acyltransferase, sialic acid O-acetyltransferase NeuD family [Maribacter arcticus]